MGAFPSSSVELFMAVGTPVFDFQHPNNPEIVNDDHIVMNHQTDGGGGDLNFGPLETTLAEFQLTSNGILRNTLELERDFAAAVNQTKANLLPALKSYYKAALVLLDGKDEISSNQTYFPEPSASFSIVDNFDFNASSHKALSIALASTDLWLSKLKQDMDTPSIIVSENIGNERANQFMGTMDDPYVGYSTVVGDDAVHINSSDGLFAGSNYVIYAKRIVSLPEDGLPDVFPIGEANLEVQTTGFVLVTNSDLLMSGQTVALMDIGIVKPVDQVDDNDVVLLNNVVNDDERLTDGHILNVASGAKSGLLKMIKGAQHGS